MTLHLIYSIYDNSRQEPETISATV